MKTTHLGAAYDIKVPDTKAFTITTKEDFIQLHAVVLAVAKRGTGKTLSLTNLLRMMKENNALDRLILVSPTYHNNKKMFEGLPLDEDVDVIEPDKGTADTIMEILEQEGKEYDEYHEALKRYRLLMRLIHSNRPIEDIPSDLILEFGEYNFKKPEHKWGGRKPIITVFFDDCQGNALFRPSSKLSSLVIKHRHQGKTKDGAIGVTLFFATQTYTSNAAGLLPAIRNNTTHLLVFRNKNNKEIDLIAEEVAGEVEKETFFALHNFAVQDPHDFLFIDLAKKKEHPSMFRRNFNEFILIEPNNNKTSADDNKHGSKQATGTGDGNERNNKGNIKREIK